MAKKKGGKDFSVDDYFAGYSKKKKEEEEDISELLAASRRKKESGERKREEDIEKYERLGDVARRAEREEREERGGERKERRHGEEEEIKSKPLIIFMYLFRAFAIVVMALLMLFALQKQVPGFERAVDWMAVSDTFIGFILANFVLFLALFIALSGLQLLYYVVDWVAHKKWKGYARAELVYSIGFALIGLLGAAAIVWTFGY